MPDLVKYSLVRVEDCLYKIPQESVEGLRSDCLIFSSPALLEVASQDGALHQLVNAARLPGLVGHAMAMPDVHFGYGFPVGGVAAYDATEGGVCPGGVGYDINCGVRLLKTSFTLADVQPKVRELAKALFRAAPSGVGTKGKVRLEAANLDPVLRGGAAWAVENGWGFPRDLEFQEEKGRMEVDDPGAVSPEARKRGLRQLGTLGAGNHFLEVQRVDAIRLPAFADTTGLKPDDVAVMIHTGSRGLGHQVGTDYLAKASGPTPPPDGGGRSDRQLAALNIDSTDGKAYWDAMSASANFAWANRQILTDAVRHAFSDVMGRPIDDLGIEVVYDLSHNLIKRERHTWDGASRDALVHRRGATRAFPPDHPAVPEAYRGVGQPVLLPGDMGTASYVLCGAPESMERSLGSAAHGAGRVLSRAAATRRFQFREVLSSLGARGIVVESASREGVTEEAPGAYKDVDEIARVTEAAKLARPAVRLTPLAVIKG